MGEQRQSAAKRKCWGGIFTREGVGTTGAESEGGREHRAVVEPLEIWGPGTQQGFWGNSIGSWSSFKGV